LSDLESFSYSVSHDLRAPLRTIDGFSQALLEDYLDQLRPDGMDWLKRIRAASQTMGELIDGLLRLSRVTRSDFRSERVDLTALAESICGEFERADNGRIIDIIIQDGLVAEGDPQLLRIGLDNLFGNAWKFTSTRSQARIEFSATEIDGQTIYSIKDNGVGFDMTYADKLFGPFQRLHRRDEFEGTGIGLATVKRIIRRHNGRIWAESQVDRGAEFSFTLGNELITSQE
jgi:signal transduction histidine kinase